MSTPSALEGDAAGRVLEREGEARERVVDGERRLEVLDAKARRGLRCRAREDYEHQLHVSEGRTLCPPRACPTGYLGRPARRRRQRRMPGF